MSWAAAITGAASLMGAKMMNDESKDQANTANAQSWEMMVAAQDFNRAEAEASRNWQERMSNTAVRRQMRDMESAGLNPILAAGYSGASTPSGAMAHSSAPQGQQAKISDIITPAVQTANQWRTQSSVIGLQQKQQEKVEVEVKNVMADTEFKKATTGLTRDNQLKVAAEIGRIRADIKHIKETTRGKKQNNDIREVITQFVNSSEMATLAQETGLAVTEIKNLIIRNVNQLFNSGTPDTSIGGFLKDSWERFTPKEDIKKIMRETRQKYESTR